MKRAITTSKAPQALGPYRQAISAGTFVFCSGQVPLDPETGELVPGDIGEQTKRVIENLRAVLAAAGAGLEHVVKTTVFLTDLGDFATMNRVYGDFFGQTPPARSTVEVSALPKGARIEVEAVAIRG